MAGTLLRRFVLPSEYAVLPRVCQVHHSVAKAVLPNEYAEFWGGVLRTPPRGLLMAILFTMLMVILFTIERRVRGWYTVANVRTDECAVSPRVG